MKTVIILNICLLYLNVSISQELSYTYPFSMEKYTDDVGSVEIFSKIIHKFDTTKITRFFEIESSPDRIRYLKGGKLVKIEDLKGDKLILYNYDNKGDIESRRIVWKKGVRVIDYKLDQDKFKLYAIQDGMKLEELLLDSLNRIKHRKIYSRKIDEKILSKTIFSYQEDKIHQKETFKNDSLLGKEEFKYKDGLLEKKITHDGTGNLRKIELFTYSENMENIETISFKNGSQKSRNRTVNYFDEKGNRIKTYKLFFKEPNCRALISEIKIDYRE